MKGEFYIVKNITFTKDTKIFINEYGVFYEGQILEQYVGVGEHKNYIQDVYIEKFIVHFKEGKNIKLYFRMCNFINKQKFTLPVDLLGKNYKFKII